MGKKRAKGAQVVVERTAQAKVTLVRPISEKAFEETAGRIGKIAGVTSVYRDQNGHVVYVSLASTHTGRNKAIAAAAQVAAALGVEIEGDITVL